MDKIEKNQDELTAYALDKMKEVEGITIYHPEKGKGSSLVSFNLEGVHTHDVASLLDDDGICVRGGHHCAMPLMTRFCIQGTTRASFYVYNTKEDIDTLVASLKKIKEEFR